MKVFKIFKTPVRTDEYSICRDERWRFVDITNDNKSIDEIRKLNYQSLGDIQHRLTLEQYIPLMNTCAYIIHEQFIISQNLEEAKKLTHNSLINQGITVKID